MSLLPWVEALLDQGHSVHVVYEACGFEFSLYRQLIAAGAHCYVIAPLQTGRTMQRVKTIPRDRPRFANVCRATWKATRVNWP